MTEVIYLMMGGCVLESDPREKHHSVTIPHQEHVSANVVRTRVSSPSLDSSSGRFFGIA